MMNNLQIFVLSFGRKKVPTLKLIAEPQNVIVLTNDEVRGIVELGFKCKQNPIANDFDVCKFAKPCYDPAGNIHKCCLCKAAGGFFGVEKCTVPCVMYNSNKSGEMVINKYGFAV